LAEKLRREPGVACLAGSGREINGEFAFLCLHAQTTCFSINSSRSCTSDGVVVFMKWQTANSWGSFKAALLAIGAVLPFCLPSQADARCGSAHAWLYTQVSAQPVTMETVPSAGPISLRSVTCAKPRSWTSQLARDLKEVWHSVWNSSEGVPCNRCPFGSPAPGRRCEGPFCSGGAPPIALPIPGSAEGSNESASLPGLRQIPRHESLARGFGVDTCVPPSACLDSIFHPPRSV
jgi:hypothetical protein